VGGRRQRKGGKRPTGRTEVTLKRMAVEFLGGKERPEDAWGGVVIGSHWEREDPILAPEKKKKKKEEREMIEEGSFIVGKKRGPLGREDESEENLGFKQRKALAGKVHGIKEWQPLFGKGAGRGASRRVNLKKVWDSTEEKKKKKMMARGMNIRWEKGGQGGAIEGKGCLRTSPPEDPGRGRCEEKGLKGCDGCLRVSREIGRIFKGRKERLESKGANCHRRRKNKMNTEVLSRDPNVQTETVY